MMMNEKETEITMEKVEDNKMKFQKRCVFWLVLVALVVDQVIKILVKTNMTIGESISVFGNWFQLYFVENNGMAFGWSFFGDGGKLFLSIFRFVATVGIAFYIHHLILRKSSTTLIVSLTLIFAGAVGNLIDSIFYGVIFSASNLTDVATIFPEGGGYAPWLYGRVVDMFYFPIINIPHEAAPWLPDFLIGSDNRLLFFRPIFNFADACVTVGAGVLLWISLFCSGKKQEK